MLLSFPYSFDQSWGVTAFQGIIFLGGKHFIAEANTNNAAFDKTK